MKSVLCSSEEREEEISYLIQQAPATTKASEPAMMKTLLMTEKKAKQTGQGERTLCRSACGREGNDPQLKALEMCVELKEDMLKISFTVAVMALYQQYKKALMAVMK